MEIISLPMKINDTKIHIQIIDFMRRVGNRVLILGRRALTNFGK